MENHKIKNKVWLPAVRSLSAGAWLSATACLLAFLILSLSGCQNQFVKESSFRRSGKSAAEVPAEKNISLVCWNVQTFFDAVVSGNEYTEFKNAEKWNKEKYTKRLNRLCDIMKTLNPDIFVMEEIENEDVVQDIANKLSGNSWEKKKSWQHVCFAKDVDSAIGCAVFSRYELTSLRTHSLDIRTQTESQPSMRPVMQVAVMVGEREVELFVNHWKSKSGGAEETEIWRDWQELVLAETGDRALNPDQALQTEQASDETADSLPVARALVMCGDFNRSAEEFIMQKSEGIENLALRGGQKALSVYSPWFRADGNFATEGGSYFYDGQWERIDNIMICGNISMQSFTTVTEAPIADEDGIPLPYKLYTGEGCSDHLPLKCVLTI